MEVRAFQAVDVAGFPFILTAWMPNKEDLEAINAGRPIMLKVLGAMAPPVAIFTYNENYDANV